MPRKLSQRVVPVIAGVAFLIMPWATFGLATPVVFLVAALFMRSCLLGLTAAASGAVLVFAFATIGAENGNLALVAFLTNMVGSGLLAAILFLPFIRAVRGLWAPDPGPVPVSQTVAELVAEKRADLKHDPALQVAVKKQERRRLARELVTDQPALADELGIGRPETGEFDDGGLIDVNSVDLWVLTTIDGVDYETAKRIVTARNRYGPLTSPEDLIVYADVAPEVVERARHLLIFRGD